MASILIAETVIASSPDGAGQGIANPTATIRSAVLMLKRSMLATERVLDWIQLGLMRQAQSSVNGSRDMLESPTAKSLRRSDPWAGRRSCSIRSHSRVIRRLQAW
jgi:isocitrate/isopropylmalate dehydrogenase